MPFVASADNGSGDVKPTGQTTPKLLLPKLGDRSLEEVPEDRSLNKSNLSVFQHKEEANADSNFLRGCHCISVWSSA